MKGNTVAFGIFAVFASVALLAAACGGAAPPPTTGGPTGGALGGTTGQKSGIEVKLALNEPADSSIGKALQKYTDTVNQKSGGQLNVIVSPSGTPGSAGDSYANVVNGVADIAWVDISLLPGKFPLTEAFNLPMNGITSSGQGARVATEWLKTNPALKDEWSEVHVLTAYSSGVSYLYTAKKPVRKIEDVAGLKVMASGFGLTNLVKSMGASPVEMAPAELHDALTKGTVDAYISGWQGVNDNRTYEVTKYVTEMPLYSPFLALVMNKDKYDTLPPIAQWLLDDPGLGMKLPEFLAQAFDAAEPEAKDNFKKAGGEIITLPPDEQARWKAAAKPVWDAWVDTTKGKFDGQKELSTLQELIQKTQ